jgi:hypothetical protein
VGGRIETVPLSIVYMSKSLLRYVTNVHNETRVAQHSTGDVLVVSNRRLLSWIDARPCEQRNRRL